MYCGKVVESNARCQQGHFVCDACHGAEANDLIEQFCMQTSLTDPLAAAMTLMDHPALAMHGPEHHFLVPAVLLAAYANLAPLEDRAGKIRQARKRAEGVRGGSCGLCGDCGAAVGTGIFVSLVTGATPLSTRSWQLSNRMTAESLLAIADYGGPRCCKRDTFLALRTAQASTAQTLGIAWPQPEKIVCRYFEMNRECLQQDCPFHPASRGTI